MQETTLETLRMADGDYSITAYEIGEGEPVCAIVSGVHGDESPAVEVADHLRETVDEDGIRGTLLFIPRANVLACAENTRLTPWPKYEKNESELRNMNRCFDTARKKLEGDTISLNMTQRMAYSVLDYVSDADMLLDLHTATWPGKKVPQTRYKVHDTFDDSVVERMRDLAVSAGLDHVMRTRPEDIGSGVLAAVAPQIGVPAITFEVGGAGHFTQDEFVQYHEAVRNVLAETGILQGTGPDTSPTLIGRLRSIYTPAMGVLSHQTELGERVAEGEVVSRVEPVDDQESIILRAPHDGVVEALQQSRFVNQNARIGNIAEPADN